MANYHLPPMRSHFHRFTPHGARVLLVLALAGCTVGPDYHQPDSQAPTQFNDAMRASAAASTVTMQSEPDPRWWHSFHDPELDSLIDRAIADNLTLRMAVLRIAQGRAQTQIAGAAGLPSISATASYNRQQLGLKGLLQSNNASDQVKDSDEASRVLDQITQPTGLFQVGFDASWELDLFGRVRRSEEAAQAQTDQVIESRNDALVSLQAEVAQSYAQLRGAQAMREVLLNELKVARDTLDLTESRQRTGLSSQMDVANQQGQVAQLESRLPSIDQQERQAANALAVLLGLAPGALDAELAAPAAIPAVPLAVPVGLPSTLARRRPDVRQAEAMLHAATAQTGVSIAQLFPDVSLSGQFGTRATDADYIGRWASRFWSIGPSISLPIFQGGQLVENVKLAKAQQAEMALNYRQTVLTALQDVENALVAYRSDQVKRDSLQRAVDAGQEAFDLARDAYRSGLGSFLDVLSAETRLDEAREAWVTSNLQVTTDLVALYKALGGGWQDDAQSGSAVPPVGTIGNAGHAAPSEVHP